MAVLDALQGDAALLDAFVSTPDDTVCVSCMTHVSLDPSHRGIHSRDFVSLTLRTRGSLKSVNST